MIPEGIAFTDIQIGDCFHCGSGLFRCTDKGTRTVVAIRIDVVNTSDGRALAHNEAVAEGWFNGPPYAVVETVFDEDDLLGCDLADR